MKNVFSFVFATVAVTLCAFGKLQVQELVVDDADTAMGLSGETVEFVNTDASVGAQSVEASLSTAFDLSISNVTALSDTGVTTLYEPCLMTTNAVIWKNVALADITAFTAEMGGTGVGGTWRTPGFIGNAVTNNGTISVQFQYKNGPLYLVVVAFSQEGNDVAAKVTRHVYQYDRAYGADFSGYGTARTLGDTVNGAQLAIRRLGCALSPAAPRVPVKKLTISNADSTSVYQDTRLYTNCLTTSSVLLWPNTDLSRVTAVSAKIGGSKAGKKWQDAGAYHFKAASDYDKAMECQFQYKNGPTYMVRVYFYQSGADVYARVNRARYQYDPLGTDLSNKGTDYLSYLTDTVDGEGISICDIGCTLEVPSEYEESFGERYGECLSKEWTTIWRNRLLSEIDGFSARMGGSNVGSAWRPTITYFVKRAADGSMSCQFQSRKCGASAGSTPCNAVFVSFRQSGADIEAKVTRCGYQYDFLGKDLTGLGGNYDCAAAVDGSGLAISDIGATRRVRVPHTVTVGGFDLGSAAARLTDINLTLAGSAGNAAVLPDEMSGRGKVVVSNAVVSADCRITCENGLLVPADGTLTFDCSSPAVPKVEAAKAVFEAGARIVISSSVKVSGLESDTSLKLVSGCELAADAADKLVCDLAGKLEGFYNADLTVDDDGDLAVRISRKNGFMIILQ